MIDIPVAAGLSHWTVIGGTAIAIAVYYYGRFRRKCNWRIPSSYYNGVLYPDRESQVDDMGLWPWETAPVNSCGVLDGGRSDSPRRIETGSLVRNGSGDSGFVPYPRSDSISRGRAVKHWCAEIRVKFGYIPIRSEASRQVASEWLRKELRAQHTRSCDINAIVPIVVESLFVPSDADLIAQALRDDPRVIERQRNMGVDRRRWF